MPTATPGNVPSEKGPSAGSNRQKEVPGVLVQALPIGRVADLGGAHPKLVEGGIGETGRRLELVRRWKPGGLAQRNRLARSQSEADPENVSRNHKGDLLDILNRGLRGLHG